jgi:hypothetical protein
MQIQIPPTLYSSDMDQLRQKEQHSQSFSTREQVLAWMLTSIVRNMPMLLQGKTIQPLKGLEALQPNALTCWALLQHELDRQGIGYLKIGQEADSNNNPTLTVFVKKELL